jgi:hypothetical protein
MKNQKAGTAATERGPSAIRIGQRVQVNAHAEHGEDFSGVVVGCNRRKRISYVQAPDGEIYACNRSFVRQWPEQNLISITVEGGVIQGICGIPLGTVVRVIDYDADPSDFAIHADEFADVNDWACQKRTR